MSQCSLTWLKFRAAQVLEQTLNDVKTIEIEIAALCHRHFFTLTKVLYFQPSLTAHCLFLSVQ